MKRSDLREIVKIEGEGWSDELDPDDYDWTEEWLPTKLLIPTMPGGRRGWKSWYAEERSLSRDDKYWDQLERVWTSDPESVGPIIVAEVSPNSIDIGDGWHRIAISILRDMSIVPAIVGRRVRR